MRDVQKVTEYEREDEREDEREKKRKMDESHEKRLFRRKGCVVPFSYSH